MKKKYLLMICLAVVILAALSAIMLHSSMEYKIMSKTEQLKAQIQEELQIRSRELFERIEVERPWYSLSPSDWTFVVKLSTDLETKYYRFVDGKFVEKQPQRPSP